jgi:sarcosine oxidase
MERAVDRYDAIVVGVGGMGSSAVYHLAKRGLDVLGLERFDIPHARGSSHGSTRVVRLTQQEGPSYVPLATAAFDRWTALERRTGRDLVTTTGSVHAGAPGTDIVEDARRSLDAHDVPYELLSGDEVSERFPGYDLPSQFQAVFQPDGGYVDCERAVVAHVEAAHEAGATVRAREQLLDWRETADGVRVETSDGVYEADDLVVTAGAWTGDLLPSLRDELKPVRRVMAWFQPTVPSHFRSENFPVFILRGPETSGYGFPVHDVPGFKFACEPSSSPGIHPDDLSRDPTPEERAAQRQFAERYFPDGAGPTMALRTCVFTESSDEHFVLGTHPDYDGVHVAAGFTGHGFKFTSVVGEILADFVVDGETDHAVDLHRIERLFGA